VTVYTFMDISVYLKVDFTWSAVGVKIVSRIGSGVKVSDL